MTFQFQSLDGAAFTALFDLSDATLDAQGMRRVIADEAGAFPCRVSLQDAEPGAELILLNYRHLDLPSPYAATHAIYVSKGAATAQPAPGAIPAIVGHRELSVRGFDGQGYMLDARVVQGADISAALAEVFSDPAIAFVDCHSAKAGCFLSRALRCDAAIKSAA